MLQHGCCIGNGLFVGFHAVLIDLCLVLFAVRQASGAAYAAADARHTFYEVGVKQIFVLFEQRYAAFLDTVAGAGLKIKVFKTLFLQRFLHRVGKSSAAGEYTSEVGCVVKHILAKGGDIDIAAVKESLKLLKRHRGINIRLYGFALYLGFFSRARTDKDDLCAFLVFLYVLGYRSHRREVV